MRNQQTEANARAEHLRWELRHRAGLGDTEDPSGPMRGWQPVRPLTASDYYAPCPCCSGYEAGEANEIRRLTGTLPKVCAHNQRRKRR